MRRSTTRRGRGATITKTLSRRSGPITAAAQCGTVQATAQRTTYFQPPSGFRLSRQRAEVACLADLRIAKKATKVVFGGVQGVRGECQ